MKAKKLFAGLLAAVMTVSAVFMSGCSGSNSEEDAVNTTSTRKIVTLNMYIMTDEKTDMDTAREVQMEINRILLPEYKTMLKLNYITEAEYWDVIEKKQETAEKKYNGAPVEEEVAEEDAQATEQDAPVKEEVLKSDGSVKGTEGKTFNQLIDFIYDQDDIELSNPDQFDIFVVDDYDKYQKLATQGHIAAIDEYLKYDSLELNKMIYPTFMSAARVGKSVYGVPTNGAVDKEFTYFVFDKDLLDKHGYDINKLTTYASLNEYLGVIKASEPGVWPVSGPCEISGAEMFDDAFIAISSQFDSLASGIIPAFEERSYRNHMVALKNYKDLGYYPETYNENARYAVKIVTDTELYENPEWTDENGTTYAAYLYDVKRVKADEAFKSAMCISNYSVDKARAMEVITLFNTNSELANLLQYGIAGENYHYNDEEGTITMLTDTYVMDTNNTGNIYIKYPLEGQENYVEDAIETNLMSAPSVYLGFTREFESLEKQSEYETIKAMCAATERAVIEEGVPMEVAYEALHAALVEKGFKYNAEGTQLVGEIFASLASDFGAQVKLTAQDFKIAKEVAEYNDYFKPAEEELEEEFVEQEPQEEVQEEVQEEQTQPEEDVQA